MGPLSEMAQGSVDFMEVAPENWINVGGFEPLDRELVESIGEFMDSFDCPIYTEHLTYCADDGHLYDLMPIPFTEEAVRHVAGRVSEVQDILGRRIGLENASYYAISKADMSESEFIRAVLEEADCDLLLDVNNIYVNSINHRYDAVDFLRSLPLERARYIHVAGHYDEADDLKVDTHGADVIDPVWELLVEAYRLCGTLPTLLERDFNLPPLEELLLEVEQIRGLQHAADAEAANYA